MKSIGIPYQNLPSELLDAFSLDPAAVTGNTRKLRGWRAVEDIHDRLMRQREAFQKFLADSDAIRGTTPSGSVLEAPISVLTDALKKLETHNELIENKAQDVAQLLGKVKGIHATVKAQYNETLSHTSVVYPEVGLLTCRLPLLH